MRKLELIILISLLALFVCQSSVYAVTRTVTNCADSGPDSLRECMTLAGNGDIIAFNIPNTDLSYEAATGTWAIRIESTLPTMDNGSVHIDGTTQTANQGDTNLYGPEIAISLEATSGISAISITSDSNTVEALVFTDFDGGYTINISGDHNTVRGCYIGTDVRGEDDRSSAVGGIWIHSDYNLIGGPAVIHPTYSTSEVRNIICGNNYGIYFTSVSNSNEVKGNYIGVRRTGDLAIGNSYGIYLNAPSGDISYNIIGGTLEAERNIISGNSQGIRINGPGATSNEVVGNYIGLSSTGGDLGNNLEGIYIDIGPFDNVIGGVSTFERNYISGNGADGIDVRASNNQIKNNYIGIGIDGDTVLGNGLFGINIQGTGAANNTIEANVISGNMTGIYIQVLSDGNHIIGNKIGTNADGTSAKANTNNGIICHTGDNNIIGGTTEAERNIISGNTNNGVYISDASSNEVKGNYIGLSVSGASLPNSSDGVILAATASYNIIGGVSTFERNYISGNSGDGIEINSSDYNEIRNNYIGIGLDGSTARANAANGIYLNVADSNTVEGNVISGQNGTDDWGIYAYNGSDHNHIIGNKIGTNADGTAAVANNSGIYLNSNCNYNVIGGSTQAERNIISGNSNLDMWINYSSSNEVKGNYIGTDISGNNSLSSLTGLYVYNNCKDNIIGGSAPGEGNLISGNTNGYGIYMYHDCDGNKIRGNKIGINLDGDSALPNIEGIRLGGNGTSDNNIIGGTLEAERNIISGNGYGVRIMAPGSGNYIMGNYIGLSTSGAGAVPNTTYGIDISSMNYINYLSSNEVKYNDGHGIQFSPGGTGGTLECVGNIVSYNDNYGVYRSGGLSPYAPMNFRYGTLEGNCVTFGGTKHDVYITVSIYTPIHNFQYNDWGYPTGPYDPDDKTSVGRWYNPVGQGMQVTDYVDYRNFAGWGTVLPAAPTGFTGSTLSPTSIKWDWTDNTTWESGYYIRDVATGTIVATAAASATTTTEVGLTPDTYYTREAVAFKIDGSAESSSFSVKTATSIGPTITVIVPNGGQIWRTEDTNNIQFTVTDPDGIKANSIDLFYSVNGGATYPGAIATSQSTESAYAWTPTPATLESRYMRVRITAKDIYDNSGTGESVANFIMDANAPSVTFNCITSGQVIWGKDGPYTLTWEASDTLGLATDPITLWFSSNGGTNWSYIASNEANDGTYSWTVPYVNSTNCRISVEAIDVGDRTNRALSSVFTLYGSVESEGPQIALYADEVQIIEGDYLSRRPTFKATITDNTGLDLSSIELYLDSIQRGYTFVSSSSAAAVIEYFHDADLEDESVMTHTVKVIATDTYYNISTKEVSDLKVSISDAELISTPLTYPQVARFLPSSSGTSAKATGSVKIAYSMTADADVTLYIIGDKVLKTIKYPSGQIGGKAGYNEVEWDGQTDFGHIIGNGIYPIKIVANGKVLGTAYLVVAD